MAHAVLYVGRELAEGFAEAFRDEERVITETAFSLFFVREDPFDGAVEGGDDLPVAGEGEDTAKPTTPRFASCSGFGQFGEELFAIGGIGRPIVGITRGVNSRGPVQRIDFEAGVIGEHGGFRHHLAGGECFDGGVLVKGSPGFLGRFQIRERGQVHDFVKKACEDFANFLRLVGVMGRDNERFGHPQTMLHSAVMSHGHPFELLSPAGNWDCARAAVANDADAIYFGLPAFNARIRADNFTEEDLPELMTFLHERGVRGFVAFNTLIFTGELEAAERQLRLIHEAGVDAIIVQDIGLAKMARAICPGLELHASTQMTITSPEALDFVNEAFQLDCAVIARENSFREMTLFRANQPGAVKLETFVHGALCVAYSGQCLTSESLGQRSANRGECAQACRMPYDLIVDGEQRDLGDKRYLLSPQDLAGIDEITSLIEAGVSSFKIEGRLKTPEYVAAVTRVYRKAIDAALAGTMESASERDRYELEMTFSRGLHSGWLNGIDNKKLVHARFGKKRGAFIGTISRVGPDWVEVDALVPVKNGDGVVFDTGGDTDKEQGGRIYGVQGKRLSFQRNKIRFPELNPGDRIWKTDDPALNAELQKSWHESRLQPRKRALKWAVTGRAGAPLILTDTGTGASVESSIPLQLAEQRPLGAEFLEQQFGRLGNTAFELASLLVDLEGAVMLPVSELNRMRRAMIEQLELKPDEPKTIPVSTKTTVVELLPDRPETIDGKPVLSVLCRNQEQVEAALSAKVERIYADFEDIRRYRDVVGAVRESGASSRIYLATPRIQKAGEAGLFRVVEKAKPDGVLVRNLGGVHHFREKPEFEMIGDFSLNVANPISADFFRSHGCKFLTISYDLNIGQVLDLLKTAPPAWFEITLHQHMPMFHMEHCVFCAFISDGTDVTNCGRPCDTHRVELRDRVGQHHILSADVGCRNTLYNGRAQSGARFYHDLFEEGLRRFRVELLQETGEDANTIIAAYQDLLAGNKEGSQLWDQLKVESKLGVVEGTLATSS